MSHRKSVKDEFWTPAEIAACGPIAHVITVERVQEFTRDNYDRTLTEEELNEVSILLLEDDDSGFIDAAAQRVIAE